MHGLLLSLFPGIDLFGRAFEELGYCVVRGPDLLVGQDVAEFTPIPHAFEGIIGGSPCQDFSRARRSAPTGAGDTAIAEFTRVVTQAYPVWWCLENVPGVKLVAVAGYAVQLVHLAAVEVGGTQNRRRLFQFGYRDGPGLIVPRADTPSRASEPCCMASEGKRKDRRAWADFCELQGLPRDFDLPGWSLGAKYRAVGNGVPMCMGRAIAQAISDRDEYDGVRACVCGCGRPVEGAQRAAGPTCRKRMQRRRDAAGVTQSGPVTAGGSRSDQARSA